MMYTFLWSFHHYLGKTENFEDQLRSVLAQFHFSYEIKQFEAKHPVKFFEWEDEARLIKVCFLIDVSKILYIY